MITLARALARAWLVWGYQFVASIRFRWQRVGVFVALARHMGNWALHDGPLVVVHTLRQHRLQKFNRLTASKHVAD